MSNEVHVEVSDLCGLAAMVTRLSEVDVIEQERSEIAHQAHATLEKMLGAHAKKAYDYGVSS